MTHHVTINDQGFTLPLEPPAPGETCVVCNRKVNHPRGDKSPSSKAVQARLPVDEAEALDEAIEALAVYTGADSAKFTKGRVIQAAVLMAGQRREELKAWFEKRGEYS